MVPRVCIAAGTAMATEGQALALRDRVYSRRHDRVSESGRLRDARGYIEGLENGSPLAHVLPLSFCFLPAADGVYRGSSVLSFSEATRAR